MKKNLTEIVFILDRSGSMAGLEQDTIGGFNSMVEKQKKEAGEALISTVLFDHETQVIHDRVPLEKVAGLTEKDYFVRGCTALLDAVGGAIHHIGNVHKYAREEDRPERTLFVITTDGMENASRRYDYEKVKAMISRQKEKYGWEFLFLGANIDAAKEAGVGTLNYGSFIQNIINFLIIAFCVFLFIKLMSKLLPKKEEAPKKPARLCPYCKQPVHDEAVKCQHCASDIAGK